MIKSLNDLNDLGKTNELKTNVSQKQIVGYAIRIIHYIMIVFAIFVPFLNPDDNFTSEWLLSLHSILIPGIIIHWFTNNNMCSLTLLEAQITNKPLDKTFIASILFPFFEINDTLIHIMAITLWFITLYKLYNSKVGFRLLWFGYDYLKSLF